MKRRPRMKTVALVVLANVVSVILLAALLEGLLRFGIIDNQQYSRWSGQTNAKHRLLILGDSFILPRSYLGRSIARALARHDVSVLNAAISGIGPFEYLSEMKAVGMSFNPHVVLLSYYAGNDLTNVQNHPQFNPEKTGIAIDTRRSRSYPRSLYLYHWVLRHLRGWRLRFHAFDYARAQAAGISPDIIEEAKNLRINPWLLNLALEDKNHLLDNILMETDENMKAWERAKQLLTEIHDLCNGLHSRLMLVTFPATIQVNESHFEFYRKLTFNLDDRTLAATKPQRLLLEFCAERNIACLDLLPAFKRRQGEKFYRAQDDHLNEKGSRVAGDLLWNFCYRTVPLPRHE